MILVIDGYNLLKKLHGPNVSESQCSAFVNLMGRYMKKRHHKVVVVFDGGPYYYPSAAKQKGVVVWYSGPNQSADDVIITYAQEHKNKELLVVTLDRELCNKVGESRAETVDPLFFYEKVQAICNPEKKSSLQTEGTICKLSDHEDEELDALMYEAAGMRMPVKDEEEKNTTKQSASGEHASKKERAYRRYIDKL
jgi:predicted RNA-binding protein with PIN domain